MILRGTASILLVGMLAAPGQNAQTLTFRFPAGADTSRMQVWVQLTGTFGGASYQTTADDRTGRFTRANDRDYTVATAHEGVPAKTLKAALYVPGSLVELIEIPSLPDQSARVIDVPLRTAGRVRLSGRVSVGPSGPAVGGASVLLIYDAGWKCEFFGELDCMLAPLQLDSTTLAPDLSFQFAVPDLAADLGRRLKSAGSLVVTLVGRDGRGVPLASRAEFPLAATYPPIVITVGSR